MAEVRVVKYRVHALPQVTCLCPFVGQGSHDLQGSSHLPTTKYMKGTLLIRTVPAVVLLSLCNGQSICKPQQRQVSTVSRKMHI